MGVLIPPTEWEEELDKILPIVNPLHISRTAGACVHTEGRGT